MSIFTKKVRGLAEAIPVDANDPVVEHIYASYPFGGESIGVRSFVRIVVFTVTEMKKRGLI